MYKHVIIPLYLDTKRLPCDGHSAMHDIAMLSVMWRYVVI